MLLSAASDGARRDRPVLAFQRYGRGKSVGLHRRRTRGCGRCTPSSRVEDQTHETFTRQLLRWLVDGVPDPVELSTSVRARRARRAARRSPPRSPTRRSSPSTTPGHGHGGRRPTARRRRCRSPGTASATASTPARSPPAAAGWYEARVEARARHLARRLDRARAGRSAATPSTLESTLQMAALRRLAEDTGGRPTPRPRASALRRRREVHRPRHHGGRRTRAVERAADAAVARRPALRRNGGTGVPSGSPSARRRGAGRPCVVVAPWRGRRGRAASPFDGERDRRRGGHRLRRGARRPTTAASRSCGCATSWAADAACSAASAASRRGRTTTRASDRHLMKILSEITLLRPHLDDSNIFTLDDPELFRYPVAYMSEPGFWTLNDAEAEGLRDYLAKGGFLIFDDFRRNTGTTSKPSCSRCCRRGGWCRSTCRTRSSTPSSRSTRALRLALRRPDADLPRHLRGQRPDQAPAGRSPTTTTTSASTGSSRTPAGCRSTCRTRPTSSA